MFCMENGHQRATADHISFELWLIVSTAMPLTRTAVLLGLSIPPCHCLYGEAVAEQEYQANSLALVRDCP